MAGGRRAHPENLIAFVDLFQVLQDPRGEHLACIVSAVVLGDAPRQIRLRATAKPIEKAGWSRNER